MSIVVDGQCKLVQKNPQKQDLLLTKGRFESNLVTQHNNLITATYDLNVTEKKLLLGCICKINSFESINADTPFSFNIAEVGDVLGFNGSNSGVVKQFRDAAHNLMRKIVSIASTEENGAFDDTVFANRAKYDPTKKTMTIYFSPGIIPYLSGLHDNLTSYRILHIGELTSKYAIRLYEVIVMWIGKDYRKYRQKTLTIEELKQLTGSQNDYKDSISMFKNHVIEKAVEQINKNTDLEVKVVYKKTGRKITHVNLFFDIKDEWATAEADRKRLLNENQINKIINNPEFFKKYYGSEQFQDLDVSRFLETAKKLLSNNPKKHFNDYANYLK